MLKRIAFATLSALALGAAASAADMPVARAPVAPALLPAFTWTGFYVGTHSGAISLDGDITTRGNAPNTIANVAAFRRPPVIESEQTGSMSGIQAGYNVQLGSFVLGVEADIALTRLTSKDVFVSTLNDPSYFRRDLDAFGTVRARVGVAFDTFMIYATGGLAGAEIDQRAAFFRNVDGAFQFVGQRSETEYGYAVGGGVEFALPTDLQRFAILGRLLGASAFTVKAEYLFYDLGDTDVLVAGVPGVGVNSYTSNFENKGQVGRIGFNYRF